MFCKKVVILYFLDMKGAIKYSTFDIKMKIFYL